MQTAPFNPGRFETTVDHYQAARIRYAPDLLDWLARETGVAGQRVLDLGCGPGFIAQALAPVAAEVLGLDPSAAMIEAARKGAASNARYEVGSSLDLPQLTGPFQLVTMGRSFHWMDRVQTLRDLDGLVAPGGAVALLHDRPIDGPGNAWWWAANEVAKRHAVMDDFAKHQRSKDWQPHEECLAASAFSRIRRLGVYAQHTWDFDRLMRNILSRSRTTEALLGPARTAMEAELKKTLAPFGPGPWVTQNLHSAIVAQRPL